MALRDSGAGRNWDKCSRTNGCYRENLTVRSSDHLVMVAVEHRGKVIFKLLLCKDWGINWSYSMEATELGAFVKMKRISYAHMGSWVSCGSDRNELLVNAFVNMMDSSERLCLEDLRIIQVTPVTQLVRWITGHVAETEWRVDVGTLTEYVHFCCIS